jgi:hypothetical protein
VDVRVITPIGISATGPADQFTFVTPGPAPTVTAISPVSGFTTGDTVTITGTEFTGISAVDFGTTASPFYFVESATSILAEAPPEGPGTLDVTVTNPNGTSATSTADQFTYVTPGPAPAITAVSPNAGTTAGGTSVSITGTGLSGASAVEFGTVAASSFRVNSDTSITAVSPSEAAGTVDITTTNPNGTSATSTADQFTVVAPLPVVTGVSPSSGSIFGGTSVTVTGSGFTFATAVDFGTQAGTSLDVVSDTSLTITAPAEAAGTVDVTVTTAGGTSTTGPADQFTYVTPPFVVTGISPTTGSTLGGTTVTITGSDFVDVTAVDFGTVPAAFLTVSNSSITVTSPQEPPGKVDVTVTTTTGTTPVNRSVRFTFDLPPTVTSVRPREGPAIGGTVVSIHGSQFTGATAVDFGVVPGTFVVHSSNFITATSPLEKAGMVDVTVITPFGTSATTSSDSFTFTTPPPVVSGVSPSSGTDGGGTAVTITGTNFTGGFAVDFGTIAASIVVKSDTTIIATSPAEPIGRVPITVTTPYGTSTAHSFTRFRFLSLPPTVTYINPTFGPQGGGTSVTITGTNFTGVSAIDFGTIAASTFKVVSPTSITVAAPAAKTAGAVNVIVKSSHGVSKSVAGDMFAYEAPPVVTHLHPDHGPDSGGTTVLIRGMNFSGATAVDFGKIPAVFKVLPDKTITATSPAEASGTVDVIVHTPEGASAVTAADTFTFRSTDGGTRATGLSPPKAPEAQGHGASLPHAVTRIGGSRP